MAPNIGFRVYEENRKESPQAGHKKGGMPELQLKVLLCGAYECACGTKRHAHASEALAKLLS